MLQALHIRDLALIEQAELRLGPGLNVVSGETGGGKSLIVRALELLRGEKAPAGLVRHGADELQVDGEFRLEPGARSAAVRARVEELVGAPLDEDLLLVTRHVDTQGRSRVRIQGRPSTLTALKEIGAHLLEILGQGGSTALMRPGIQAETLDHFARCTELRLRFAAALGVARTADARLQRASGEERARAQRLDFLRFQLAAMEELRLEPGEVARLDAEHALLAHQDRLRGWLSEAADALQDADANATDLVARAARAIGAAARIDAELAPAAAALAEIEALLGDAVRGIQSGLARLELDPARLAEVEDRIAELRRGLARFGPTEAEFLAALTALRTELSELEEGAGSPAALERELQAAHRELTTAGEQLQTARRKAAPRFATAVERELAALGMPGTRLRVALADPDPATLLTAATESGPAPVELEVRINTGEPFRSLAATASGGELARLVLAIKKCLADQDRVPFVVFDEIDAEIGGRLGLQVGRKLREVAQHHQLLIVTHLPQVAVFANAHFLVGKQVRGGRTRTQVQRLDAAGIERELAAMSTGDGADADAITQARHLLARAQDATEA